MLTSTFGCLMNASFQSSLRIYMSASLCRLTHVLIQGLSFSKNGWSCTYLWETLTYSCTYMYTLQYTDIHVFILILKPEVTWLNNRNYKEIPKPLQLNACASCIWFVIGKEKHYRTNIRLQNDRNILFILEPNVWSMKSRK